MTAKPAGFLASLPTRRAAPLSESVGECASGRVCVSVRVGEGHV